MLVGGVHHVFVHLVGNQQHIGGRQQVLQGPHVGIVPDGGAGVVGAVDDDGAGARRHGCRNGRKVRAEGARCQRHAHGDATSQFDVGHITVVAGVQHDDLVPRMDDGQNARQDGLGGPRRDGDLAVRVIGAAMQGLDLAGHGLAQRRHAGHGGVLVVASLHGSGDGIDQPCVAVEIGKALAQVDRAFFGSQRRHDAENGGAHVWQTAGQRRAGGQGKRGCGNVWHEKLYKNGLQRFTGKR